MTDQGDGIRIAGYVPLLTSILLTSIPNCAVCAMRLAEIFRLEERIRGLEMALAKIQWGSCDGCNNGGDYCPECKEHRPLVYADGTTDYVGHAPECSVGNALAPMVDSTSGTVNRPKGEP